MDNPAPYLQPGERVIIYDGVCRLCNGWVNFLIRHDKKHSVRMAPVQSEAGRALSIWAGLSPENVNTIVLIDGDHVYKRSEAIFRVMSFLPFPWRAMAALRILPLRFRDACYNGIALNRYRLFGRYDSVKKLEADHSQRFLKTGEEAGG
ncbi:thiol-disulfide oxidoreductase [Rouxiella silvae]|uniref:Thiol-disulfide oxidoreductase n=1 Tax=Rouxiella silvae TaxID=1646373 RepID=A0AA40X194_9GAMM|nr:thiol-disulfide oxidoreductase DCC family protein [Rouxiella silvae]KQN44174.1 thiol-disulfide oxidoreductase [Serratia sp. Leaf50]MBF6636918.1 thiol-disulfide oxidoreductase DCC family protein [Rouxiella silvae]ORJ22245.1 thiol-disulfide oxidoreductase [Rouxiella silvae]